MLALGRVILTSWVSSVKEILGKCSSLCTLQMDSITLLRWEHFEISRHQHKMTCKCAIFVAIFLKFWINVKLISNFELQVLSKKLIMMKNEVKHIMSERNVLLKNLSHPFLVSLKFSFQSLDKLYFVLDYVNGGDVRWFLRCSCQNTYQKSMLIIFSLPVVLSFTTWRTVQGRSCEILFGGNRHRLGPPPFTWRHLQVNFDGSDQQFIVPCLMVMGRKGFKIWVHRPTYSTTSTWINQNRFSLCINLYCQIHLLCPSVAGIWNLKTFYWTAKGTLYLLILAYPKNRTGRTPCAALLSTSPPRSSGKKWVETFSRLWFAAVFYSEFLLLTIIVSIDAVLSKMYPLLITMLCYHTAK